jgi:hypothetical protein
VILVYCDSNPDMAAIIISFVSLGVGMKNLAANVAEVHASTHLAATSPCRLYSNLPEDRHSDQQQHQQD